MNGMVDNEDTCRESENRIDELETRVEVKDRYRYLEDILDTHTHTRSRTCICMYINYCFQVHYTLFNVQD